MPIETNVAPVSVRPTVASPRVSAIVRLAEHQRAAFGHEVADIADAGEVGGDDAGKARLGIEVALEDAGAGFLRRGAEVERRLGCDGHEQRLWNRDLLLRRESNQRAREIDVAGGKGGLDLFGIALGRNAAEAILGDRPLPGQGHDLSRRPYLR